MTTIDRPVLVLTDHTGDAVSGYTLTTPSAQLLTLARGLTSAEVIAVALNPAPDLDALGRQAVARVLVPDLGAHSPRVSAVVTDALAACVEQIRPGVVLCVANYRGREVAGRLGALLGSGAAVDVTSLEVSEEGLLASKSALAGSWTTCLRITRGTPVIALRPSVVTEEDAQAPTVPERVNMPVSFSREAEGVEVLSSAEQVSTGRVSLAEARTVVVGGRGTDGDFSPVEALADALDGAVGATRVCADEGWVPRSIQIGQTGVSVSPNLYVGLGVSGAIHHTVGMRSAAHVVAVCDDPDAPIFEICDFGVVGDLFEVVPQAIEALEQARGAR
ncbi:electron transfer flavoprotein subunit alpha/FixB family protein [Schaalia sp. 19OD2882]|uniref:electron transfer flavoprotein subunit alpha/FixB family protein n=1 Tax=Schaalia sp. 19OD2882 TaxID=2794089 RepID=UPI001C1ED812|nr:electron transfer flavoprotein subunit alpha/FixB family protein [Schaalia sp. 19OD2882]QWW20377.1 electron transfer flavoprotein subunit alpha/FixB family protein [Schaalia sp. 19OD2882]